MKLDFCVCLLVWHFHIALCFQVVSYTQIHFVSSLTQQHSAINKTIDILWSRCTRSNIFTHRHSVFIVNLKYICQYFFSLIPSITVILILFYCIHAFLFYKNIFTCYILHLIWKQLWKLSFQQYRLKSFWYYIGKLLICSILHSWKTWKFMSFCISNFFF